MTRGHKYGIIKQRGDDLLKEITLQELDTRYTKIQQQVNGEKTNYAKSKLLKSMGKSTRIGNKYEYLSIVLENIEDMKKLIQNMEFVLDNSIQEEYYINIQRKKRKLIYNDNILQYEPLEISIIVLSEIYLQYGGLHISSFSLGNLPEVTKENIESSKILTETSVDRQINIINKEIERLIIYLGYIESAFDRNTWRLNYLKLYNCYYEDNIRIPEFNLNRVKNILNSRILDSPTYIGNIGKLSISMDYYGHLVIQGV